MRKYAKFYLTPKGERAARGGHPWVFGEEVTHVEGSYVNGDLVDVVTPKGKYLGTGFVNDTSKIRVRIISTNTNDKFDEAFWERRLRYALDYRRTVMGEQDFQCCRLIFGEADMFPGLTVDRFNDLLVTQTLSLGIELRKQLLFELLLKILREMGQEIRGIFERNDVKIRLLEGMEEGKHWFATPLLSQPGLPATEIIENGIRYTVDVENGQKTGFFLDQKYNRQAIAKIAQGKHVLDCFTHTGSFALNAAQGGAASVTAVDISAEAVQMADHNAAINGYGDVMHGLQANVFDLLSELVNKHSREYDFIILDPPAFTKSGSTVKNAIRGYKEINLKAMKLLPRGGYLATCSCSHFMKEEYFVEMLREAAKDANVSLRQIEARQQAPDHPILWSVPETNYLKFYIFQVV
ncbi:class I SAM-dependent rRNA methyltransferase [uncultured Phascolarctobacterium sp.]|uniref:class I SAM-dependent rRNA methyltransferase n=1 Tax=uncultured Phascolarctobacterium sp. TaxID=512296 RepID=UPI0025FF8CA8|nr:class I SAM-dependent rRNA methyltransferase [uncultured Phascolarctobacterium sp.]